MQEHKTGAQILMGIKNLETATHFALAILALASGVYTYLGVRSLLDGTANQVFFAAIVYSTAVSVGIYVFWAYLMRFLPLIQDMASRLALLGVMMLGGAMIVAMSSWLNAAALAGSAALEQHLAVTLEEYAGDLDAGHARALSSQSLLPDVQRASERFSRLAEEERREGALTGTSGSGSVAQLLGQMGAQLDELAGTIQQSRERTAALFESGTDHLSTMRTLVSAPGPLTPRADRYAEEAVALTGVIAALQETSIAPSVRRAAEDLSIGFIAPIADGGSAELIQRQDAVMVTVRAAVEAQSAALASAADEILAEPRVESRRFVPLSSAEAVIRYASDFMPSWAGAISIDLLPAVLVFILAIAHRAMRRDAGALDAAESMTAAELMRSVQIYRQLIDPKTPAEELVFNKSDEADTGAPEPADDTPAVTAAVEKRPDTPPILRPVRSANAEEDRASQLKGTTS